MRRANIVYLLADAIGYGRALVLGQSLDMTERNQTLIGIQTDAIAAILSLPQQGERAASFGLTLLNRRPRGIGSIRKRYEKRALRMGWNARQIAEQWADIKDMARLEAIAG